MLILALVAAALVGGCGEAADLPVQQPQPTEGVTDTRAPATAAQSQAILDAVSAVNAACASGSGEGAIAPHVTILVNTANAVRIDAPMAVENSATTPRSEIARLITPLGECAPGQALALERGTGIEPE